MGDGSDRARIRFSFDAGAAAAEYDSMSRSAPHHLQSPHGNPAAAAAAAVGGEHPASSYLAAAQPNCFSLGAPVDFHGSR
jgi:hypothetical protein